MKWNILFIYNGKKMLYNFVISIRCVNHVGSRTKFRGKRAYWSLGNLAQQSRLKLAYYIWKTSKLYCFLEIWANNEFIFTKKNVHSIPRQQNVVCNFHWFFFSIFPLTRLFNLFHVLNQGSKYRVLFAWAGYFKNVFWAVRNFARLFCYLENSRLSSF